ncbi:restriction endonuclease [Bacillus mycoides]|uniref:restriction endonuclease n=1 Tax=Bacillus mycoides TaxID=1405 RepID=UPI003CFCB94B
MLLKRKAKAEEKKKRDKLCKDTGELAEKYFNIEHLSIEDREALFESISVRVNEKIENTFPNEQKPNVHSSTDEINKNINHSSPVALYFHSFYFRKTLHSCTLQLMLY